jgi:sedoheptulose-bisphosphatase
VTEDIREWDYGDYEGITSKEIQENRKAAGVGPWDIWRDGCPGGEYEVSSCEHITIRVKGVADHLPPSNRSTEEIVERLDRLVHEIRSKYHAATIGKPKDEATSNRDVLVVAHGHILRAFAMRWIGKPLTHAAFLLEAGGVGTLRYDFALLSRIVETKSLTTWTAMNIIT